MSAAPTTVAAVCFDLDDTLFPQSCWLQGAWDAVAARAARDGVDHLALRRALDDVAAEGSDRGHIIDRALARVQRTDVAVAPLVAAFCDYRASELEPYPGVVPGLERLAALVPLGVVSDGNPDIQRAKLAALGLADVFQVAVWSDEHGRRHRKPDPLPFVIAVERLCVQPGETVYVGDRPDKDVAGAIAAGLVPLRVRTGEWRGQADGPGCWASVATCADAVDLVVSVIGQPSSTPTSARNSRSPGASR